MQLYILGPAFGLPSIDAECSAAVAVLQLHARDKYEIIPTHDTQTPLPRLVDGTARIFGFNNIVRHLVDKRVAVSEIDLNSDQRALRTAVASLVESQAQTLLDISLYVGFENYRLATRPAFSKILPWHANYILPPARRSAARNRTDHLGISSIDVDNVHEDMSNRPEGFDGVGKQPQFEAETQKRASLLLPRKETVRTLLQRPEHAAIFKLNALADNFFEPLQDMLGDNTYFVGKELSAVDCLLYGYLSLMLYPELPQDWLSATMKRKYKKLVAYVERVHQNLSLKTDVEAVLELSKCDSHAAVLTKREASKVELPWSTLHRSNASETLQSLCKGICNQVPLLGDSNKLQLWHAKKHPFLQSNLRSILLSTTTFLALAGYLSVYTGLLLWPRGEEVHIFGRRRISDFGHLGAALAGINFIGRQSGPQG
ncbi:Metaxin-like protein [Pseudocercospora fuligena]|uniref:Metaxin-like protein n=1 Tax=Pseudocercospora fuligena TaxID=685502 RepID=A0A8H6REW7_9PEZI|nr:Metaxin-like protein [Pseudocercospora fuligena]